MAARPARHIRREEALVPASTASEVVVGHDGSRPSEAGLSWAIAEARLRRLPLVVCHAWQWPYPGHASTPSVEAAAREAARRVLDAAVARVSRIAGVPAVLGRFVEGSPAAALVMMSSSATLIVLGARGGGGFDDLRVGSAAVQVPAHASCPVVVVKDSVAVPVVPFRVVVGVDGSPASEAALAFAFEEAAIRHGELQIVCSWWDAGAAQGTPAIPFTQVDGLEQVAAARFQRTVAPWLERYPHVEASTAFVMEPPREALREASVGASLLVVGNRGIGTASATLLGAVSRTTLHDAPCPVAIVHATRDIPHG
ncbi:MAG: universal stress protein [Streptosporangiales bacterium]|nr:universal stress protein [Streptosporangiales bacterium]